jgi:hypothetical protein
LIKHRWSGLEMGKKALTNFTIDPSSSPIVAKNDLYRTHDARNRGITMQTRIYQVQHWPNGQWDREHNWRKVKATSEKEAAERVCGLALAEEGRLALLRARVLKFGDLKQRSATQFYAVE